MEYNRNYKGRDDLLNAHTYIYIYISKEDDVRLTVHELYDSQCFYCWNRMYRQIRSFKMVRIKQYI